VRRPSCGFDSPRGARFCAGCGTRLAQSRCPACGCAVQADHQLCAASGHRLAATAAPKPTEGERRQPAVRFCDLVGYNRLTRELGTETVHDLTGMAFLGPALPGWLALFTDDGEERRPAVAEAEALLAGGSVSHNDFFSCRAGIEAALATQDWSAAERYAAALEDHTRAEPLPFADFIIARGRTLAAWGRGERDPAPACPRRACRSAQCASRARGGARRVRPPDSGVGLRRA
jgi:Double zinc ribbon